MKFNSILKQQYDYARNSIAYLDYSRLLGTVEIRDSEENELYLQGQDVYELFVDAQEVENRFQDETFENCLILCLYSHVDLLGN